MARLGSLELDQDLRFQSKSWMLERVAWIVMLLVLAAALAGAFGPGFFLKRSVQDSNGALRVEYARFVRASSGNRIRAFVGANAIENGGAEIWIGHSFLKDIRMETVSIQPESVTGMEDGQVYRFRMSGPAVVVFDVIPFKFGWISGEAGIAGRQRLPVRQFVYP